MSRTAANIHYSPLPMWNRAVEEGVRFFFPCENAEKKKEKKRSVRRCFMRRNRPVGHTVVLRTRNFFFFYTQNKYQLPGVKVDSLPLTAVEKRPF